MAISPDRLKEFIHIAEQAASFGGRSPLSGFSPRERFAGIFTPSVVLEILKENETLRQRQHWDIDALVSLGILPPDMTSDYPSIQQQETAVQRIRKTLHEELLHARNILEEQRQQIEYLVQYATEMDKRISEYTNRSRISDDWYKSSLEKEVLVI